MYIIICGGKPLKIRLGIRLASSEGTELGKVRVLLVAQARVIDIKAP